MILLLLLQLGFYARLNLTQRHFYRFDDDRIHEMCKNSPYYLIRNIQVIGDSLD